MLKEFEYNKGSTGKFRISASQFDKFVDKPHIWFRQQILQEDKFEGSTSSVLGTIIHVIVERVTNNLPVTRDDINEYLNTLDIDIDRDEILYQYPIMSKQLVNNYILKNKHSFYESEKFVTLNLDDEIEVGGTIDRIEKLSETYYRIVDFKTYNSKTKPKNIPNNYKYQLLVYAYIYTKLVGQVREIRLVYVNRHIEGKISEKTGKKLKTYPSEVTVLTEPVTDDDLIFIESLIDMCHKTLVTAKSNPELIWLLFRDPRLREIKELILPKN